MNNTDHARVRRLRRRANKLGEEGLRIVPHRHGTGTFAKEGWHLIDNATNKHVEPSTIDVPVPLDVIEAAIDRIEENGEGPA